jgi:hypothetical protein
MNKNEEGKKHTYPILEYLFLPKKFNNLDVWKITRIKYSIKSIVRSILCKLKCEKNELNEKRIYQQQKYTLIDKNQE